MTNRKAKPTPADKMAAHRLRALWDSKLAEARAASNGWTQETAGAEMGITQGAISQYLNGDIRLGYGAVLKFAKFLGVAPTDIRDDLDSLPREADEDDFPDVLGYAQAVGLGEGVEAEEYAKTHKFKFRADSLRRKHLFPDNLGVVYGEGDSMLPRIHDGDAILFNTAQKEPEDEALFVIQIQGGAAKDLYSVKRCRKFGSEVYFEALNPHGDHQWRKPRPMADSKRPIEIIGRVRWIGSWED